MIKKIKSKRLLISFVIVLPIIIYGSIPWTPKITDERGQRLENSIATLDSVVLGNIEQSILIRGQNIDNPILLFLHGGPGYPQISFARKFQSKLERDFIIVNWDQRGSGKSYSRHVPQDSMTRDQFIMDTFELIDYLLDRFDQEKIYLAGHSWGSDIGVRVVEQKPLLFYAYIGIGQVIHSEMQE